jgi:hypothetical protein
MMTRAPSGRPFIMPERHVPPSLTATCPLCSVSQRMGRNNYIAATWSFASHLMNGKSGVFLPFNGKFLSNLLGCPVLLQPGHSPQVLVCLESTGSCRSRAGRRPAKTPWDGLNPNPSVSYKYLKKILSLSCGWCTGARHAPLEGGCNVYI